MPIEEIEVGDEVKSMNPQTGEIAYKKVTNTHTNRFDPIGLVSLKDETDGSETHLSVTATHPFYDSENGWTHASLLKVGDKLIEDDGETLTVTEVTFNSDAPINLTYNLEVADFHTYFVGEDGVLTHNGWAKDTFRAAMLLLGLQDPGTPNIDFNPEYDPRGRIEQVDFCQSGNSGGGPQPNKYGHQWIVKITSMRWK